MVSTSNVVCGEAYHRANCVSLSFFHLALQHCPAQWLAGRENACSRGPTRVVHALEGQVEIRVVERGREGRQTDTRVGGGRGRGRRRMGACSG